MRLYCITLFVRYFLYFVKNLS